MICPIGFSKYSIDKLSSCSLKELQEIKGIGKVKASQIIALFEFNRRCSFEKKNNNLIRSAKDVFLYTKPKISHFDRERFLVLHLNTKNQTINEEIISIGTLNSSLVHPRRII